MTTKTMTVPNISCEHCTRTIEREVGDIAGVSTVRADEASQQVTVEYDEPATWGEIEALLVEIDYLPAN